jgi:hypothetical protein
MKRFLPAFAAICLTTIFSMNAQITINWQDFPGVGTLVINAVDESTPVDPGQPGLNQVWDFSNLVPTTIDSTYYILPEGAPGYENYPDANVATDHNPGSFPNGGYNVNFWNYSGTGIKAIADESLVNVFGTFYFAFHIEYIPRGSQVTFPFTYGSTSSQDFVMKWITAIRNEGVTTDSSKTVSHVNMDCLADGSGTMILPDGSFPVLRVRETWSSTDSSYTWTSGAWVYESDTVSNWTQYRWYANDIGEVGFYRPAESRANGFTFFKSETIVGIEEPLSADDVNLYPNPASTWIRIDAKEKIDKIEIVDNSGRMTILSENQSAIDVSKLSRGLYFVRVYTDNSISSKKLFKL